MKRNLIEISFDSKFLCGFPPLRSRVIDHLNQQVTRAPQCITSPWTFLHILGMLRYYSHRNLFHLRFTIFTRDKHLLIHILHLELQFLAFLFVFCF